MEKLLPARSWLRPSYRYGHFFLYCVIAHGRDFLPRSLPPPRRERKIPSFVSCAEWIKIEYSVSDHTRCPVFRNRISVTKWLRKSLSTRPCPICTSSSCSASLRTSISSTSSWSCADVAHLWSSTRGGGQLQSQRQGENFTSCYTISIVVIQNSILKIEVLPPCLKNLHSGASSVARFPPRLL